MTQSNSGYVPEWSAPGGSDAGWRQQLGELALACAGSFPAEEFQRLHDLRRLLATAPAPDLVGGLAVPSEDRLGNLIAADAGAAAVLAMLGPNCGYLLSRGAGGQHLASVVLPGSDVETSAGGDSLALALIGALALALAESGVAGGTAQQAERGARLN